MTGESFFLVLAQIGLAIGAFTGLFSAFRRADDTWTHGDVNSLRFILAHTIGLLLCSIAPLALYYLGVPAPQIWTVCSFCLAVFFAMQFIINSRALFSNGAGAPEFRRAFLYTFLAPTEIFFFVQAGNVKFQVIGLYVMGLMWLLLVGIIQFCISMNLQMQRIISNWPANNDKPTTPNSNLGEQAGAENRSCARGLPATALVTIGASLLALAIWFKKRESR